MPALRHRFEFMLMEDEDSDEMRRDERVLALVAPWMSRDDVTIERSAIYTFHGLVAHDWRRGPVLIAGDSAHQMPPFLGQGMCSGLRDAATLAWKLDLTLRGAAPADLLDTYGPERGAHVREIVQAAIAFGEVICTVDPVAARERDLRMLADPAAATRRMPFGLPSLPAGELVLEGGGELFVQPPAAPGGKRLDDVVGQRFAVIARSEEALGEAARWWEAELGAFVATLAELGPDAGAVGSWLSARGADVTVIRPDHYVLWAGSDLEAATRRVAPLLAGAPAGMAVTEGT
jgi:3-(3-hydroxy-phenyl)propionate hydroxylase